MNMQKTPRISIVTPSLNSGKYLEEAVQSVLCQGYPDFQHVVFDGGSTDSTLEILSKYPHLEWSSEPDRGQAHALNKGFRIVDGDIVGWLNADERYLPDCFLRIAGFFLSNPSTDIAYGDYRVIHEDGSVFSLRRALDFDLFTLKYSHTLNIETAATFLHRRILDRGNYLNEEYQYAMDSEYFLRLALDGSRFKYVPGYLADYRWHSECKTASNRHEMEEERLKAVFELDPILSRIHSHSTKTALWNVLCLLATGRRRAKKLVRGYYFGDDSPLKRREAKNAHTP